MHYLLDGFGTGHAGHALVEFGCLLSKHMMLLFVDFHLKGINFPNSLFLLPTHFVRNLFLLVFRFCHLPC